LLKKIISNFAIQESFKELLQTIGIEHLLPTDNTDYFYDFLLISVLNQVWIHYVYEPFAKDICYGLIYEIKQSHAIEKIEELMIKKGQLLKAYKMISEIEDELLQAPALTNLIQISTGVEAAERENYINIVDHSFAASIESILCQMHKESTSETSFAEQSKRYE
jgi:hypothetical protein